MELKTAMVSLPVYDMEEFYTYIEDKLNGYICVWINQLDEPDDLFDDKDIEHWEALIEHYKQVLSQLRSSYTDKHGNLLDEFNDIC